MDSNVIRFDNATFAYGQRVVLDDISLHIARGEFIGILGPNGSGKTTLLKAILGLIFPTKGSLNIFDCSCERLRCHHRAKIGYLPQKELIDPNFPITVFETVMMGRYSALGLFHRPSGKDRDIVFKVLDDVDMQKHINSPLGSLSGGQQQRVLIARALAQVPKVLLLDEPTTGIDAPTQHRIIDLIKKLHSDLSLTLIFVTHDINMVSPFVDRIAILNNKLYAVGRTEEVINKKTLSKVYGKDIIVMPDERGSYVIIGDHHHA